MAALPTRRDLEDSRTDTRDAFIALRTWARGNQRPGELAQAAHSVDADDRQAIFAFLLEFSARKPLYHNQAKQLLKTLYAEPSWRRGCLTEATEAQIAMALAPHPQTQAAALFSPPSPSGQADASVVSLRHARGPAANAAAAGTSQTPTEFQGLDGGSAAKRRSGPTIVARSLGPGPLQKEEDIEAEHAKLLAGMPPPEAFSERSKLDAGDTFQQFRLWARRLTLMDVEKVGRRLPECRRHNIFEFLIRMAERKVYIRQVREVLKILLSAGTWVEGKDAVHGAAVDRVLNDVPSTTPCSKHTPALPFVAKAMELAVPRVASPITAKIVQWAVLPGPPVEMLENILPRHPSIQASLGCQQPKAMEAFDRARRSGSFWAKVKAALAGGATLADDSTELIKLCSQGGLEGEARLSATSHAREAFPVLLGQAVQRSEDVMLKRLQQQAVPVKHLIGFTFVDIKWPSRKKCVPVPWDLQADIEQKIHRCEQWTSNEQEHVWCARPEQRVCYLLAYAVAQAHARCRGGCVWIPVGMRSGFQGVAGAVCVRVMPSYTGAVRILVCDVQGSCILDGLKAIGDALPAVQTLFRGRGIRLANQVEVFGHGLHTVLRMTSLSVSLLSETLITTCRGYPICGSVLFLLASMWITLGKKRRLQDMDMVGKALAVMLPRASRQAVRTINLGIQDSPGTSSGGDDV